MAKSEITFPSVRDKVVSLTGVMCGAAWVCWASFQSFFDMSTTAHWWIGGVGGNMAIAIVWLARRVRHA